MQQSSVEVYVRQSRERLRSLEKQQRMHEVALENTTDPNVRARRWQSLARLEEEIEQLERLLATVDGWG